MHILAIYRPQLLPVPAWEIFDDEPNGRGSVLATVPDREAVEKWAADRQAKLRYLDTPSTTNAK